MCTLTIKLHITRFKDKILIKRKIYFPAMRRIKFEYFSYLSFKITKNKTFTFIAGLF